MRGVSAVLFDVSCKLLDVHGRPVPMVQRCCAVAAELQGLIYTAGLMYNTLHFFNIPVHVQEVRSWQQQQAGTAGQRQQLQRSIPQWRHPSKAAAAAAVDAFA
jgi:hypothetical protein